MKRRRAKSFNRVGNAPRGEVRLDAQNASYCRYGRFLPYPGPAVCG